MSNAFVPYNGTAGWSGTDTSQQRAIDNIHSGRELNNQQLALLLLKKAGAAPAKLRRLEQELDSCPSGIQPARFATAPPFEQREKLGGQRKGEGRARF